MHCHPMEVKCLSASRCEDLGVRAFSLHCCNPGRTSSRESKHECQDHPPQPELTEHVPGASALLCPQELLLNRQFQQKANIDIKQESKCHFAPGCLKRVERRDSVEQKDMSI